MAEDVLSLESLALKNAGLAMDSLTVYRRLIDGDQVIARLRALIDYCRQGRMDLGVFLDHYGEFFASLADSAADSLEDYLIEAILFHDNSFTRSLENGRIPSPLAPAVAHDLDCLQQLAGLAPAVFKAQAATDCWGSETELALLKRLPEWRQRRGRTRSTTPARTKN